MIEGENPLIKAAEGLSLDYSFEKVKRTVSGVIVENTELIVAENPMELEEEDIKAIFEANIAIHDAPEGTYEALGSGMRGRPSV